MSMVLPDAFMNFGLLFSFAVSALGLGLFVWDYFSPAVSIANLAVSQAQVTGLTAALAADVKLAGSTMTGPLILSADPTVALGAATKQYVDSGVGGALIASKTVEAWSAILDSVSAGTYPGCTKITTLGTVTTGTWNAGIIPVAYGGTGTSSPSLVAGANITVSGAFPSQTVAVSGVIPGTLGGTGVNNGAALITLAGNLTTVGGFNLSFTTAANTSLILPASGTLVNTAVAALPSLTSVGVLNLLQVSGASLSPTVLAGTDLGTTSFPFNSLWLGTSATNQCHLVVSSLAAPRTLTVVDPKVAANFVLSTQSTGTVASNAVTMTGCSGALTTPSLSTAASTAVAAFTVTNTFYTSASQNIFVTVQNGTNTTGSPIAFVSASTPGSNTFAITIVNVSTAAALNGTVIVNVMIC